MLLKIRNRCRLKHNIECENSEKEAAHDNISAKSDFENFENFGAKIQKQIWIFMPKTFVFRP